MLEKNSKLLQSLNNLNDTSLKIFQSQIRNQPLKSRGRRCSLRDKILSLSIYKQSGKAYRYLSKVFALPSYNRLRLVLNEIPFLCGNNDAVLDHLKIVCSNLKLFDRYCMLMFDEVALQPLLHFNTKYNFVEGFVDFGDRRQLKLV